MLGELIMLNTPKARIANVLDDWDFSQALRWQTCLRQVVLMHSETVPQKIAQNGTGWEIYQAERAYQLLLEVICGLHSPLLGETEVLGQFRETVLATQFPENNWGSFLRQLTADLLRDAKRVRQQYLQDLGHRSYGSHASQWLQGMNVVGVLGAGQLASELTPWLIEQMELRVYARNPVQAAASLGKREKLQIHRLDDNALQVWPGRSGLVIAAPLTSNEICAWIDRQSASFMRILDLRGEAVNDPLPKLQWAKTEIRDLQEFFFSLKQERQRGEKRIAQARTAIAQIAQRQLRQVQCRPYGWEDLCA
jgi:glutamyl-tRNA reductase